jgi:hypothetical protein
MNPGGWRGQDYHQELTQRYWQQQQQYAAYQKQNQARINQQRTINQLHTKVKERNMSGVLWCNINDPETNVRGQVGHAFSDQDPDAQQYRQTRKIKVETGNSYGKTTYQDREEITTIIDMCGYHVRKQMPFQADNEQATAIEAAEVESVQAERDMWKAKYEAEKAA